MAGYAAWTGKAVERRVLEAAETLKLSPRAPGPREFGNSMPAIVRERWKDAAPAPTKWRRPPTAAELSRMTQTWGWINAHPDQAERQLLYAWAWMKTRRGVSVSEFAAGLEKNSRALRYAINKICAAIAGRLNEARLPGSEACQDAVEGREASEHHPESPTRSPAFQRAADAVPRHDPADPENEELARRIERGNRRREKMRRAGLG